MRIQFRAVAVGVEARGFLWESVRTGVPWWYTCFGRLNLGWLQFSNWDNWVRFLRIGKRSRKRFCQKFWVCFGHMKPEVPSKGRCPVGIWNQESLAWGRQRRPATEVMSTQELPLHGAWPRWWHHSFLVVCDLCVSMTKLEGWLSSSHLTFCLPFPPPPTLAPIFALLKSLGERLPILLSSEPPAGFLNSSLLNNGQSCQILTIF